MENFLCPGEYPKFLILSSDVPHILYYALVPGMLSALFLGLFVLLKGKNKIESMLYFILSLSFFIWGILNLILFAVVKSDMVMTFWSILILVEPLIYVFGFYFSYVFLVKKDISFFLKLLIFLLLLPLIIFIPTDFNLSGVDVSTCDAIEGPLALYYTYFLEILFILWIIIFSLIRYFKSDNREDKNKIRLFSFGIVLFLITFSSGNIIGSFTTDWVKSQYGYFGMPVFIGFLAYLIVKFKAFNIKLLGAQALVVGLAILIGSQFFFIRNNTNRILTGITLLVSAVFGYWLIRSVKDEVRKKEELQKITNQLVAANAKLKQLDKAKTEFLSIASHQLRAPLTAVKGFASLMLDGSYGEVSGEQKDVLKKIFDSNERLVALTENLLNISRIEAGRMAFNFAPNNIEEVVNGVVGELKIGADKKNIFLHYEKPVQPIRPFMFDKNKMHEVVMNLIENAVKYTFEGGVTVKIQDTPDKLRLVVSDTGIGISQEGLKNISTKFYRTENARRSQADGTGIGVYVVRKILEAHQANLNIFSQGEGQGSVFTVEMDKNFKPENNQLG